MVDGWAVALIVGGMMLMAYGLFALGAYRGFKVGYVTGYDRGSDDTMVQVSSW